MTRVVIPGVIPVNPEYISVFYLQKKKKTQNQESILFQLIKITHCKGVYEWSI